MPLVKVLRHGQITVPKSFRKKLGIHEGNILEVLLKNNGIFIKPKALADTHKEAIPDKEWTALASSSFSKDWENEKDASMTTGKNITIYQKGAVVLIPFPFTDLTATKIRPAVVVSIDKLVKSCHSRESGNPSWL